MAHSLIEEIRVEHTDRNSLLPMLNDIIHQNHPAVKPLSVQQLKEDHHWSEESIIWYRDYLVLWEVQ